MNGLGFGRALAFEKNYPSIIIGDCLTKRHVENGNVKPPYVVATWKKVHGIDEMLHALEFGPIVGGIDSDDDFAFHRGPDIFSHEKKDPKLNHAIAILKPERGSKDSYWIVQNSYGTMWGSLGRGKVLMGKNIHGIEQFGFYPVKIELVHSIEPHRVDTWLALNYALSHQPKNQNFAVGQYAAPVAKKGCELGLEAIDVIACASDSSPVLVLTPSSTPLHLLKHRYSSYRQVLHGTASGMSTQIQAWGQQHLASTNDIKTDANPLLNPRTPPDGSLTGIPGSNQGSNNLTLKGWPLTGLDQLRLGLLQHQKSFMQASQPFHQLQMLTSHHQQQLLLAQQNMTSASTNDFESRKLRQLLNNKMLSLGKEGLTNSICDIVPNVGSPSQAVCSALPCGDADMLIKLKMAQMQQPQQQQQSHQQQLQENALSCQLPHISSYNLHSTDKMGPMISMTMDGSLPNSFQGNDQASKNQTGRKRKQPMSSSGPANSSGTANTAGPLTPSIHTPGDVMLLPSTPSNHTPGDMLSLPSLAHATASAKPILVFGSENCGNLASALNQLSLELWNMNENKTMALSAHDGLIAALAVSSATGLVASASHDKIVKLWK